MTSKVLFRLVRGLMACAALAMVGMTAAHAAGPNPNSPYIESMLYSGSGCPLGTVGQSLSDDRTTFTMIFDNFIATLGPGMPITENRKNCLVAIKVHTPPGTTWAASVVDRRGYMQLAAGVRGAATIDFADINKVVTTQTNFVGPTAVDYLLNDDITSKLNSRRCSGSSILLVNAQIALFSSNPSGNGLMTADSLDGKQIRVAPPGRQQVHVVLKPCKAPKPAGLGHHHHGDGDDDQDDDDDDDDD